MKQLLEFKIVKFERSGEWCLNFVRMSWIKNWVKEQCIANEILMFLLIFSIHAVTFVF